MFQRPDIYMARLMDNSAPSDVDFAEGCAALPNITDTEKPIEVKGHVDISINGLEDLVDSNMAIASSIISASQVISRELKKIASALERNNRLNELREIKLEIRDCEKWLDENNLLGDFYREVDMSKKYREAIEPSANELSFLAGICYHNMRPYYNGFLTGDGIRILQNGALATDSDPISYVKDLIHRNGLGLISGTAYFAKEGRIIKYDRNKLGVIIGTDCLIKLDNYKGEFNTKHTGYQSTACSMYADYLVRDLYTASFTEQQTEELVKSAILFYENAPIVEAIRINWLEFYKRRNSEIALNNLRMLATELDSFTRKMKIMKSSHK